MLKEKIQADLKQAIKQGQTKEKEVLRLVLASFLSKEKEKRYQLSKQAPELNPLELEEKSKLNEEEALAVLFSESKKRKEAALEFEKGQRPELAAKEREEEAIIRKYLPELLSEEKIKEEAGKVIKELDASGPKEMGRVMAVLAPRLKGRAEGAVISQVVKELLSEQ